jgi:diguanylate cyclase (GGDEF)-like protein
MQTVTLLLIVATATLLLWQHFGMVRSLELSVASGHPLEARDDHGDGGATTTALVLSATADLRCELVKANYAWPYCGYHFLLGEGAKGLDLSVFDRVTISMEYAGPGHHSLRGYIRQFDPGFSTVDDYRTQKINEIEFTMPDSGEITIPLPLFRTAAWWNTAQQVPLLRSGPDFSNATAVELYTGSTSEFGEHRFRLRTIRFEGKWISEQHLALALVGAWCLYGCTWMLIGLGQYRLRLGHEKARVASLTTINRALHLETRNLADQAFTDPLTGALNRHGLRDVLVRRQEAGAGEFDAVLFVDIDHFKQINDRHGHDAGDAVLRLFAAAVLQRIRESDELVRWGGEEFLVLCAGIGSANATTLGQQLRTELARMTWPHGAPVTVSIGVALVGPADDIGSAIARADAALYRAKQNGRDRVELAADADARADAEAVPA